MTLCIGLLELELEQFVLVRYLIRQEFLDDVADLGGECDFHLCDPVDVGGIGLEDDVHIWRLVMLVRQQRREHFRTHLDKSSPVGMNQTITYIWIYIYI